MADNPLELDFVTVDVFTHQKYKGNPLAIVHVPDAVAVTQEQKQAVAREFNLSESTFVREHRSNHDKPSWTVDIFLTTAEIPFAGHPTIGTACHLLSKVSESRGVTQGKIEGEFNIKAGLIRLQYDVQEKVARAAIPHDVHVHKNTWTPEEVCKAQPALAFASQKGKTRLRDQYPIVSIVKGMAFVLIELDSEEALGLVATTAHKPSGSVLDQGAWGGDSFLGTYYYVRLAEKGDGTRGLRTRMIEGTLEDPATGSAASGLAAYLSLLDEQPGQSVQYDIVQGVEMGRRSDIKIEVIMANNSGIKTVYLQGGAVQVMQGRLTV